MKNLMIISSLMLSINSLSAQNQEVEIKNLEQAEVQAILKKDTATLHKLWDKDYVVNSPNNVIVFAGKTAVDRPVLKNDRTSFTRSVEQITINENVAVSMGTETVVPVGSENTEPIKRRFTNIWMKNSKGWRLVARHASIVCK